MSAPAAQLILRAPGPALTVQDLGRPGYGAQGLSRGGAFDPLALWEAAALLGLPAPVAAVEMPGLGARFEVTAPLRLALTGAPMQAELDGRPLAWHAAHPVRPGEVLRIGGATGGAVGYLTPAGGLETPALLGSRATHLAAGIGAPLDDGARLPVGPDPDPARPACTLRPAPRFGGGTLRLLPGPQTDQFGPERLEAFCAARFARGPRSNRQALQLLDRSQGAGPPLWHLAAGAMASEPIQAGDVQITGDGTPYVLGPECQTIGGYPRIGSLHPEDLPRLMQAGPGDLVQFTLCPDAAQAARVLVAPDTLLQRLRQGVTPLLRDPAKMTDLLSYQLISGVTAGDDLDR
ncbi:biotin-dependent carboxyltransferase family protein [Pseudooceanicola sp. 200-1SW]|uniref:5-oxoprolinase subunit C family protein n=1 Tax=Pseudooceanicola sp. 200-1SW TaxID=3425949 RepID=UPI003D7FDA5E